MFRPKKYIHFIQSLSNGGCENMLLRLLPAINNGQTQHIVITLREEGVLSREFISRGIIVENVGQKNFFDFFSYFRLVDLIKKNQPAAIITYLFRADLIGRFFLQFLYKQPVVSYLRTTYNSDKMKFLPARIFEIVSKKIAKKYLANSQAIKDYYVNKFHVQSEKITVIPNGIDVSLYKDIKRNNELRRKLSINDNDFVIICVANFHIYKGHKYLLEAFEILYNSKKNIHLLLVGEGKEKDNLVEQIKDYESKKHIHFLSRRNDVPELLKISNLFILATLFEGMSNAIMEAMASGIAIIATDIPENRQLIKNNETGLLVSSRNSQAISRAIEKIIENGNLKESLCKKAQEKISSDYDLKIVAEKFSKYLNDL